jgi:hypothetical protein
MAEEVKIEIAGPAEVENVDDTRVRAAPRISWGAIFGGAFAALGLWLLLYAFGLAVGLSTVDPNDPGSIKGSGIFTGIWSGVSPLIALFVGGFVASRVAGVFRRGYGAIHGLVMWGLATVAGAYLAVMVVSSAVSGAASVGRAAIQSGGAAIGNLAGAAGGNASALSDQLGLDWNDALAPINQRLRAEGKPPVTAAQLQATARDAVQQAVRSGRFDRAQLEATIAQNTAMSRADAQQLSQRVEMQFESVRGRVQDAAQAARTGALQAADATGKAFWGIFAALALGLIAALVGGALGVPRGDKGHPRERGAPRASTAEPTPPRGPIVPPREAYPR